MIETSRAAEEQNRTEAVPYPRRVPWLLSGVGAIVIGVALLIGVLASPQVLGVKLVSGSPVANASDVVAVVADRKAAEAAQKAADDAAALASLETQMRDSMQAYFDDPANDLDSFNITVLSLVLIKADGSKYEGMATMTADGGPQRQIPVHVTADDQNSIWTTDPGALAPLFP